LRHDAARHQVALQYFAVAPEEKLP
jgi:hypothetical protein